MAVNVVTVDRQTPDLFPATVQEYRPEDHPARFVVESVDRLDPSRPAAAYAGTGSRPHHPALRVALLFSGDAAGVFSSRKLAQATHDAIASRDSCADTHPDHRTIADFRRRVLDAPVGLCTDVRLPAPATGRRRWSCSSLIVAQHLTEHTNDTQEIGPALARLDALPEALGAVDVLPADTGYHSQENLIRPGAPVYCLDGVRHQGGENAIQALVWDVGTCHPDVKGDTQGEAPRVCEYRCGVQGRSTP
jgi:transposase